MKLKSGDVVIVRKDDDDFNKEMWGRVGVVIGKLYGQFYLVKFPNCDVGHCGGQYYTKNNTPYDGSNKSHWYVLERKLYKIKYHQ